MARPKPRTPQRTEQVRATILRALKNVMPHGFREDQLLTEIDTLIPGPVSDAELSADLKELYSKSLIDYTTKLGGLKRWTITEAGLAEL